MIRNVVVIRLEDGHDRDAVAALMARFASLDTPGTLAYTVGADLGVRPGGWSWSIVADFIDEDAYRRYDADEEHNRLRAALGPHAAQIARVQFEV